MRGRFSNVAAISLVVLLAGCITAWRLTRDAAVPLPAKKAATGGVQVSKVDERILQTARQLVSQADTSAEQQHALEAARLADQEVDLDFATALREAAASAPPTSGPLHDLATHITELKARVAADQQRIAQLTKDASASSTAADRLDLLKAQLTLDQDELDDAQQDLARLGGDEHATLERALQEHEAAIQGAPPTPKVMNGPPPGTLREQLQMWLSLGGREDQVEAARQAAEKKAAALAQQHKVLEGKLSPAPALPQDDSADEEDTAGTVDRLRRLSDQRKTLTDLDKRGQIAKQVAVAYQQWLAVITARRRSALHLLLGSLAWILGVLLAAVLARRIVRSLLAREADRRRLHQLRIITRIAIQLVALMAILLIIFGVPTQMPTIIGLTTAGLTVVLKDFIVAFFGWFVLMGRNGIRLGDWVEINGVGGEVIEIGVLRTVLLEMGNWTNTGHPTGRRVTFVNNFAIEGHYFNFSTVGQWLWDELQVTLPADNDPYKVAEQIRESVERETEADAKLAEQDWERVTKQYGTRAFSARPTADLRPAVSGLIVNIRYITRAPMRYEVKSRLFQTIVDLLHGSAAVTARAKTDTA